MFYEKTTTSNEDTLRKRVYAFQEKHSDKADSFTGKHLQDEGVPRSTLYQTLRRKEDGKISAERQCASGRPAKIMTNSGLNQLVRLFKCGISQRKVAKMKCTHWALKI